MTCRNYVRLAIRRQINYTRGNMSKKIVIELDGKWILEHRSDDRLPIEKFKDIFTAEHYEVQESSFTTLDLMLPEGMTSEQAETHIRSLAAQLYPNDNMEELLTVRVADVVEANTITETADMSIGQTRFVEQSRCEPSDEVRKVLDKVSNLVGAAEFKQFIAETAKVAPYIQQQKAQEIFYNRCYLFSIGDGYGLSTYLNLFSQLLAATGLRKMHSRPVLEERLGPYKEGPEPFEDVMRILHDGDKNRVRVLCIDINEWLNKTNSQYFRMFLREVEKVTEEYIVVFRVAFLDKAVLANLGFSLNDLLSVKTVTFPPLSRDELQTCAKKELEAYGFEMASKGWVHFHQRISEEKSDGKFYGLSTVKKVVRELVYNKILANAEQHKVGNTITVKDARTLCQTNPDELSGMEQLDRLIGNEDIKKKLNEVLAQIELAMQGDPADRPCIHMRFVGNPGTGKTTVARIVGKILKEKGVLRVGGFFEYAGRDFCGRYIGETAPKTASICRDAYGSVLFIDEAYSLYRGDGNDRDYGREALDTLIAEMENHRNDFVVIMAGYTDDMEKLMQGNHGLASRMPYTIEFPNFSREQLYLIFESLVKSHFKYEDALLDAAKEFFLAIPDEVTKAKEFSNARYVRNLYERTWAKAAMRCQLANKKEVKLTKDDFDRACSEKEFGLDTYKKTKIGF